VKRFVFILLILTAGSLSAAEKVSIEADSIQTPEESLYHAVGDVKVFQGGKTMTADEIYYNKETNQIHAIGNVFLQEEDSSVRCSEMKYDTETETGIFTDARAFIPPYNWISASTLDKKSPLTYSMRDVQYSTCEGEKPDWSFKATSADITAGGYLTSWNTTARIKNFPILYSPYFIYPAKTERETGFLVPNFGFSSSAGAFIQPQFFLNLGVDHDMTVSTMLADSAPAFNTFEHRLEPDLYSTSYTYLEYTDDEKLYPERARGGYKISSEPGRFFLYNYSRIRLSDDLYFRSAVATVSDYEYLDDYKNYSLLDGYENRSDRYIAKFMLSYRNFFGTLNAAYVDEMEYNVGETYQKEHVISAPSISQFNTYNTPVISFKYFYGYDNVRITDYRLTYETNRQRTSDKHYERQHASLTAYKPFNLYIGTLTPSLTLYDTFWYDLDEDIRKPANDKVSSFAYIRSDRDSIHRQTYMQRHTFKLNEIYKRYSTFKHSIYNTLVYEQIPWVEQRLLVDSIDYDNIDRSKQYEYSLSNYFKARNWDFDLTNKIEYDMSRETKRYRELETKAILSTGKNFYALKHEYNKYDKDTDEIWAVADVNLYPFRIQTSYFFDKSDYGSEDNNTSFRIGAAYSGEKYDLEYVREISGMNKKMSWANMNDRNDIVNIVYKKDCWSFGVSYIRETTPVTVDYNKKDEIEQTVMFTISLRGLGEMNSSLLIDKTEFKNDEDEQ